MLSLSRPVSDAEEDDKLASILKKPNFSTCEMTWKQAYINYRSASGDPWIISPAIFSSDISELQYSLYDSRKRGGPLTRIRQTKGLICCPMCGSPSIGTLDHYLPRDDYPEFSVLPSNLLPACGLCNSGAKGKVYKGAISGERFLHPYFDKLGSGEIWYIKPYPPYEAATFSALPSPSLPATSLVVVAFHLRKIFGPAFYTHIETYWSQLPAAVASHIHDGHCFAEAWNREMLWSTRSFGLNGWRTALVRGVIADAAAASFINAEAEKLIPMKFG